MENHLRIIGDIHGERNVYLDYLQGVEYTIQIGDLDFDYEFLLDVSPDNHRVLAGNHDNYDQVSKFSHFLGDFGVHEVPEFGEIFFVRGGWSIDYKARSSIGTRRRKKDLWEEEELTIQQCYEAYDLYQKVKPKFLISHEAPLSVVSMVTNPQVTQNLGFGSVVKTKTNQLLQIMHDFHAPKIHVFGHYHCSFDREIDNTRFVCVDALKYINFEKDFMLKLE